MTTATEQEVLETLKAIKRQLELNSNSDTMSIEAAALELGCSESRVYALLKKKQLTRARRAGKQTRVTRASVRRYLLGREASATPKAPGPGAAPAFGDRIRALAKKE